MIDKAVSLTEDTKYNERSLLLVIPASDYKQKPKLIINKADNKPVSVPVLTRREKEVLQLLNEGLNGPQIAEKLFLSHYTVETHRKNLMQKFNVNSTQLLLKIAREKKLI